MPSPIAHTAVAFVLWPVFIKRRRRRAPELGRSPEEDRLSLTKPRGLALLAGVVFMLNAPDLDFATHLLVAGAADNVLLQHGGATHSLFVGAAVAILFAAVLRPVTGLGWMRLWLLGTAAWWSHVLLDYLTWGGGVAALWPISDQRFASAVPLFYGVRHSEPWAWHLHLITVASELVFVVVLWLTGRGLSMTRSESAMDERPPVRRWLGYDH